jgi:pyruvate dehydrogenase E2 component (dihydrolipoamide acetyltransferase)
MPQLSESMESGTILTWLLESGQHVESGDDLVEIETDKATMTYSTEESGVLQILVEEGATVPVGAPIARVGDSEPTPTGPATTPQVAAPAAPHAPVPERNGDTRVATSARATPVARRAAAAHGIRLVDIAGTGPLGRITQGDVLLAAGLEDPQRRQTESHGNDVTVVKPSRSQAVIARRMTEAKTTIPEFQVLTEVDMSQASELHERLKALETEGPVPSLNDFVVKAAALALRDHPRANGSYRDGRFELYSRVNIGIAVAAAETLVVPTVFDADRKALGARDGSITPAELSGGTFTVSNLGMYGMTALTPVINIPQAAILGVGGIRESLARRDGEIVDRLTMTLTLTCDHRILYGADAAQFLAQIKHYLEHPLKLAL